MLDQEDYNRTLSKEEVLKFEELYNIITKGPKVKQIASLMLELAGMNKSLSRPFMLRIVESNGESNLCLYSIWSRTDICCFPLRYLYDEKLLELKEKVRKVKEQIEKTAVETERKKLEDKERKEKRLYERLKKKYGEDEE